MNSDIRWDGRRAILNPGKEFAYSFLQRWAGASHDSSCSLMCDQARPSWWALVVTAFASYLSGRDKKVTVKPTWYGLRYRGRELEVRVSWRGTLTVILASREAGIRILESAPKCITGYMRDVMLSVVKGVTW